MKRSISTWQMIGFLFTAAAGTLLHFLYDWSGQSVLIAPFSAVNESIWEHLKLLYFPMLLFALVEDRFFADTYRNFWCVKLVGMGAGLLLIPTLYYTYTGALGVKADWLNITIFFVTAAYSYYLETRLLQKNAGKCLPWVALGLLLLVGVLFVALTFLPLHIPLFQDPQTGSFGRI